MRVLLDTNVLLRSVDWPQAEYQAARSAIGTLLRGNCDLCFFSQNAIEFWNVCTRPIKYNGLGLETNDAIAALTAAENQFSLILEDAGVYRELQRLVIEYSVQGAQVHCSSGGVWRSD